MGRDAQEGEDRVDPNEASKWQYMEIERYGFATEAVLTKGEAYGILTSIKRGEWRMDSRFTRVGPTKGQAGLLWHLGVPDGTAKCKRHASLLIDAIQAPLKFQKEFRKAIDKARSEKELNVLAKDLALVKPYLPAPNFEDLVTDGKRRRLELQGEPEGIPE